MTNTDLSIKLFNPGDQIALVPDYLTDEDVHQNHSAIQWGFVVRATSGGDYFCRYWISKTSPDLRTKSTSERTPGRLLISAVSHSQEVVDEKLREIQMVNSLSGSE
jgi:hypothetical protein